MILQVRVYQGSQIYKKNTGFFSLLQIIELDQKTFSISLKLEYVILKLKSTNNGTLKSCIFETIVSIM